MFGLRRSLWITGGQRPCIYLKSCETYYIQNERTRQKERARERRAVPHALSDSEPYSKALYPGEAGVAVVKIPQERQRLRGTEEEQDMREEKAADWYTVQVAVVHEFHDQAERLDHDAEKPVSSRSDEQRETTRTAALLEHKTYRTMCECVS
jgi:hypothetical protein